MCEERTEAGGRTERRSKTGRERVRGRKEERTGQAILRARELELGQRNLFGCFSL